MGKFRFSNRSTPASSAGAPATADPTGTRTPEERIELLERTIREANLRALREQWDPVERIDTPLFVQRQIDDLTAAVHPRSGVTR